MQKFINEERGSVSIIVAVGMTVFLVFAAFAVDIGRVVYAKQALQNSADSAVLAAAQELPDSTANATSLAQSYMTKNGSTGKIVGNPIYSNSNKRITITAQDYVSYTVGRILTDGVQIQVDAAAETTPVFGSAPYALFSGSDILYLKFSANPEKNIVVGAVHANGDIDKGATVTGQITTAGTFKNEANITATEGKFDKYDGVHHEEMPGFAEPTSYISQATLEGYGFTYKKGVYTIARSDLDDIFASHGILSIDGDVKIDGNGGNINPDMIGTIIATGDITFDGSGLTMADASVNSYCLVSLDGDISFDGSNATVNGRLYAPQGTITFNGTGGEIFGSVIADEVVINGGIEITYDGEADGGLKPYHVRLVD